MPNAVALLVCGGRRFANPCNDFLTGQPTNPNWRTELEAGIRVLDKIHRLRTIRLVIEGEADGADTMARHWAEQMNVPVEPMAADWKRWKKAAGFRRNTEMLMRLQAEPLPRGVVAFPGGRGTDMMVRIAREAGEIVWQPLGA